MTAQVMFMNEPVENFAPIEGRGRCFLDILDPGTGSLWERVEESGKGLYVDTDSNWLLWAEEPCGKCAPPYGCPPGCHEDRIRDLSDIFAARESYQQSEDFVLRKACPGL